MDTHVQPHEGARAEELIATIYAAMVRQQDEGSCPGKIFLSPLNYRRIQEYRKKLGGLDEPGMDYLGNTHIFHLEIYIDDTRDMTLV